jgi:CRISPR/Cas system-associated endonuclease Cas3-HD
VTANSLAEEVEEKEEEEEEEKELEKKEEEKKLIKKHMDNQRGRPPNIKQYLKSRNRMWKAYNQLHYSISVRN